MKQLAIIRNQDIVPGSPSMDPSGYPYRETARAVLFDGLKVALMYVADEQYYKLPGGGVDPGETNLQAVHREILEEVGYHIKDIQELGEILEYKDLKPERQRSLCFIAHISGELTSPQLTEEEKAAGFRTVWADNLDQAIDIVENAQPENIGARFIRQRELLFLRAAQDVAHT